MRKWRLMAMAAGGMLLAGAVVYSYYGEESSLQPIQEDKSAVNAAASDARAENDRPLRPETSPQPESRQVQAKTAFDSLQIRTIPDAEGFRLEMQPSAGLYVQKTLSMNERVVHVVNRYGEEERGGGDRLEAVVVEPGSAEARSYLLFEYPYHLQSATPVMAVDEGHVVFVRPTEQNGTIIYDLAKFDPADGRVAVVAERFWSQPLENKQEPDFLLGMHVAQGENGGDKVLVTSFKGRTWLIDWASRRVQASPGASYPAYGDPGSSPTRELLFPSPDLTRMVYQPKAGRQFQVLEPAGDKVVAEFGFGEGRALMNPGISWNAESTRFYQEFGDGSRTLAARSDTGLHLYAQSVRFYDRNGKPERTFTLRGPADARMNVYGWASEHEVWLETFRVHTLKGDTEPKKRDIAYKRYDIRTGVLTDYRTAGSPEDLKQPVIVQPFDQPAAFVRRSYLLADNNSRTIWPSPHPASAIATERGLYLHVPSDVGDALYRWTKAEPSWRWLDGRTFAMDERAGEGVAWRLDAPVIHRDRWLVYVDRDPIDGERAIRYAKTPNSVQQTAGGLPILPPSISEAPELNEWWTREGYYKPAEKEAGARVLGKSRYGTIRLKPQAGEVADVQEDGLQFYGDYTVTFEARAGARKELPAIQGLRLEQEASLAHMERVSFDGWDLLLFRPQQYLFGKGLAPNNPRYLRAFAVTRKGEAFPLVFRYADRSRGVGERSLTELPLDDNQPVRRQGETIVMMAGKDQLELTLQPNLAGHELIVTDASDRRRESEQMRLLAERYTELIEQALGLDESLSLPKGPLEANQLISLFTEEAWNNPGFQRLKGDFDEQRTSGHPSRAFSWPPIDIVSVAPDTVRFTMTLNLFYAIGHAAHLEVALKLEEGAWKIHDLGTLNAQKGDGVPGYDGLVIEDPLRLE
ncbi:hypothetical protein ACFFSY_23665 [Paenibacillus aurantiacus]|uniref:Uncharacterized protein n=1 Tax=Paenibacillus aurantiacus TaxID=1936118 RepID=A0ABV5KUQ1_9BACL